MMMEITAAKIGRLMKKLEIFMAVPDYSRAFGWRDLSSSPTRADCVDVSLDELGWLAMETFLGVTAAPGRTRCRPLTTMTSPSCKPSRTTRNPSAIGPSFTERYASVLFLPCTKTYF